MNKLNNLNFRNEAREEIIQRIVNQPYDAEMNYGVNDFREGIKESCINLVDNILHDDMLYILVNVYCYHNEVETISLEVLSKLNKMTYSNTLRQLINL